jgi:hypothetical protein
MAALQGGAPAPPVGYRAGVPPPQGLPGLGGGRTYEVVLPKTEHGFGVRVDERPQGCCVVQHYVIPGGAVIVAVNGVRCPDHATIMAVLGDIPVGGQASFAFRAPPGWRVTPAARRADVKLLSRDPGDGAGGAPDSPQRRQPQQPALARKSSAPKPQPVKQLSDQEKYERQLQTITAFFAEAVEDLSPEEQGKQVHSMFTCQTRPRKASGAKMVGRGPMPPQQFDQVCAELRKQYHKNPKLYHGKLIHVRPSRRRSALRVTKFCHERARGLQAGWCYKRAGHWDFEHKYWAELRGTALTFYTVERPLEVPLSEEQLLWHAQRQVDLRLCQLSRRSRDPKLARLFGPELHGRCAHRQLPHGQPPPTLPFHPFLCFPQTLRVRLVAGP